MQNVFPLALYLSVVDQELKKTKTLDLHLLFLQANHSSREDKHRWLSHSRSVCCECISVSKSLSDALGENIAASFIALAACQQITSRTYPHRQTQREVKEVN